MWLNSKKITSTAIDAYRRSLVSSCPKHIVIDDLFDETKLDEVMQILQKPAGWQNQNHTYSALYVDNAKWQKASDDQRFVQRDIWRRQAGSTEHSISNNVRRNMAQDFLSFLRSKDFMSVLSGIFDVVLTDKNVADPDINTNYFRLSASDFVKQHADDSPGREVCMLLYLNKEWQPNAGGNLVFMGKNDKPVCIAPLYNRCVLFDPSSEGSEHWVAALNAEYGRGYRYNVTSWYWSE